MLDQKQECLDAIHEASDHMHLAMAFIKTIHNQIATLSAEIQELERAKMQVFWQTEAGQEYWKTCKERDRLAVLCSYMRILQDLRAETMADFETRRAKD